MPIDREEWFAGAERAAAGAEAEAGSSLVPAITFLWGEELYGLPVRDVREVAKVGAITPVPGLPAALLGALNLRGEILPVADLRSLLGLEPGRVNPASRLVVVTHRGERVGLLVDGIGEIFEVPFPEGAAASSDLILGQTILPAGQLLNLLGLGPALAALLEGR